MDEDDATVARARAAAVPLDPAAGAYDVVRERARGRRYVLLGEASHGTADFYRARAAITRRLIEEGAVTAVAVEADWPDAYRVNRFVRGLSDDATADEALGDFRRFPTWMWRNADVSAFVTWLRGWNDALPPGAPRVGFYGLDLYSLHASMAEVVTYLEGTDPAAAERARERYGCFDHFGREGQDYGYAAAVRGADLCEDEALDQLLELQRRGVAAGAGDPAEDADRRFHAEQNARLVVHAEEYYRAAFRGGSESWNLRDRHMATTLEALGEHLVRRDGEARIAVWEHNSHIGDARATELSGHGELNLGQLVRERHGAAALLVGFTTYTGTVTAADGWGEPARRMDVRPALPGSWEDVLHRTGIPAFALDPAHVPGRRLERAIGVVYRPRTERRSHCFAADLAAQFDLVVHLDRTAAVVPLDRTPGWGDGDLPDTYPSGL